MLHEFSRTEMLLGTKALNILYSSKVAVFGIGGVGSYVVEGLARCGVGKLVFVDSDSISITNINRQIHATWKTIGRPKVEVMRERVLDINPKAQITIFNKFYLPETASELLSYDYDYIVDAVDTVTAKIDLVIKAKEMGIPIICSMGAGNKLNPAMFQVDDIYNTSVDPLAKVMRRELRKRGIDSLKVVYSKEDPIKLINLSDNTRGNKSPGSVSFVPSVAGLIIAGEVVKDIIGGTVPNTAGGEKNI
jgi:tRNA A37 threonylcarbamoyladenosine dehydratase